MNDDVTTNVGEILTVSPTSSDKLLPILTWPDERLKKVALRVEVFDEQLEALTRNMLATMRAHNGIGLAAPQVGVSKRLLVIQVEPNQSFLFINPEITQILEDEDVELEEGCLSVPGYFEKRKRPARIIVKYDDIKGITREVELSGLYSFVVQHEIDHLDGKLFIDDLSQLKKQRIKDRIKKVKSKTHQR